MSNARTLAAGLISVDIPAGSQDTAEPCNRYLEDLGLVSNIYEICPADGPREEFKWTHPGNRAYGFLYFG